MPSPTDAQLADIDARVRALRIIHLGLAAGVAMFAAVIAVIARQSHPEAGPDDLQLPTILSGMHALMLVSCTGAALFLFGQKTAPQALREAGAGGGLAGVLSALQTAYILRVALLEGPVLLGEVTVLMAATSGALALQPLLWANLLSAVLFVALAAAGLPPDADDLRRRADEALSG